MKPIAVVTGMYQGHCVVRPTDPAVVLPAGLALYTRPYFSISGTQRAYLEYLSEPRSLTELAAHFECTTEGARKHVKALLRRDLITYEMQFKRKEGQKGAWAKYYQRKT